MFDFFNSMMSGFGGAPRSKSLIDNALAPRNDPKPFALSDSVGVTGRNKPDDVKKMETGLSGLGFMKKTKPTGQFGEPLKQGMQSFQQANGLAVDGQANVNGPTATTLGQQVKEGNDFYAEQTKNLKAFGEAKEKQKREADRQAAQAVRAKEAAQAARTKAASQAARATAQAKPPQPWWKSKDLPEVSGEDYQSNRRTMDATLKYADDGDLPNLQAQALRDYGHRAKAEFADYMQQLHERDPKRAKGFEKAVFDRLDNNHKAKHFPELAGGAGKSAPVKKQAFISGGQGNKILFGGSGDDTLGESRDGKNKPLEVNVGPGVYSSVKDISALPKAKGMVRIEEDKNSSSREVHGWDTQGRKHLMGRLADCRTFRI